MSLLTLLVLAEFFCTLKILPDFSARRKYIFGHSEKNVMPKKIWHAEKEFVTVKFFTMILGTAKFFFVATILFSLRPKFSYYPYYSELSINSTGTFNVSGPKYPMVL